MLPKSIDRVSIVAHNMFVDEISTYAALKFSMFDFVTYS
jgi:hypothetical protein